MVSAPIYVPASFFSLATYTWPVSGPAPTFPIGRITTYSSPQTYWGSIHTASSTINWAPLDALVAAAKAAGATKGIYCLYRCPTFLVTTGAGVQGPWGFLGECSHPSDLGRLTYFIQEFINRNNTVWGRFFDIISAFNEPTLGPSTVPGPSAYEWSTEGQFVDKLWTVYAAVKATDPTITVLSPGVFRLDELNDFNSAGLGYFSGVYGTANPTKRGWDCYEGLATHQYNIVPEGRAYSGRGTVKSLQYGGTALYQDLVRRGYVVDGPIHITEMGVSPDNDGQLTRFLAETPTYRESFVQCVYLDAMAAGVKSVSPWSFGNSVPCFGDLIADDPGVVSGLRKIYNACADKWFSIAMTPTGGRLVTYLDGTTYTVTAP